MAAVVAHATAVRAALKNNPKEDLDVAKVFEKYDTDKSNRLSIGQLKEALEEVLGFEPTARNMRFVNKKYVTKGEDGIALETFGEICTSMAELKREMAEDITPYEGSCLRWCGYADKKLPYQDEVLRIYNNSYVVTLVALVIVGNFVVNIVEKEIDPDQDNLQYEAFWNAADITFNILFIIELWANMWGYGGPVRTFWASPWNVFDTVIVTVGFLTMINALGPPLDQLKLLRAFRVFRLFKRVESLNKIIVALISSIPGVINAFVVMFIFFCIYAILAVELFRGFGEGGIYNTTGGQGEGLIVEIDSTTARGFDHGIEYYGTFMRALYTLFQVMTGESWSEAVARPLLFGFNDGNATVVGIYFVSFIILMQMVLINVVVAVLLDKFVASEPPADDEEEPNVILGPAASAPAAAGLSGVEPQPLPSPAFSASGGDLEKKLDAMLLKLGAVDTLAKTVEGLKEEVASMRAHLDDKKKIQAV